MVEGSLTVALVAFGGGEAPTVAAVLLYRLISFWVPLPIGGACYLGLFRARRKAVRRSEQEGEATGRAPWPGAGRARPALDPAAPPALDGAAGHAEQTKAVAEGTEGGI